MRPFLRFLLLDDFDPDTGELSLRVAFHSGTEGQLLRMRLHLGRSGDSLDPLRRELRTHVHMPLPTLWEHGLKTIIHALEDELGGSEGRSSLRYLWVQTQILHPSEESRSTPNHAVPAQVEILRDWAHRLDQEGESIRASELMERLLLLSPKDRNALGWLTVFFRAQGMPEEMSSVCERWLEVDPENLEAMLRFGEALLAADRADEAKVAFERALKLQPMNTLAHLGMAQALALLGGDPFAHLDAALELDRGVTVSVLKESYDYRLLAPPSGEQRYALEELPALLGVSSAEVRDFLDAGGLPSREQDSVRESELARWVGMMNRYRLLPNGLNWSAPTPRRLPELS
jgi:Tetratricopeptide repeat